MMHLMEAPECRNAMGQHVPKVERVIHQHDGQRGLDQPRQLHLLEQPPAIPLDLAGEWIDDGPFERLQGHGAHGRNREIAHVPTYLVVLLLPEGVARLGPQDGSECA